LSRARLVIRHSIYTSLENAGTAEDRRPRFPSQRQTLLLGIPGPCMTNCHVRISRQFESTRIEQQELRIPVLVRLLFRLVLYSALQLRADGHAHIICGLVAVDAVCRT